MRKRERENPCRICGHYHKYEDGEVCGHRMPPGDEERPPFKQDRTPPVDSPMSSLSLRLRLSISAYRKLDPSSSHPFNSLPLSSRVLPAPRSLKSLPRNKISVEM